MSLRLKEIAQQIDSAAPSLKFCGMGAWLLWSFSSYRVSTWGPATTSGDLYPQLLFFSSTIALILSILFLAFTPAGNRLSRSNPMLLAVGAITSAAAFFLEVLESQIQQLPVFCCVLALITGVGSGFFLIRTAAMLGSVKPPQAFKIVLGNTFFIVVAYLVLQNLDPSEAIVFHALTFFVATLLFSLDSSMPITANSSQEPLTIKATPPLFWRFCLIIFMMSFVLTLEVSCFYSVSDATNIERPNISIALWTILIVCAAFLITCPRNFSLDFSRLFHPLIITLVIVFSAGMLLGPNTEASVILTGASRFIWQMLLYAICAFIAYCSRTSNIAVTALAHVVTCTGDIFARLISLAVPGFEIGTEQGLVILVIFVVLFLVILTLVLPQERMVTMCNNPDSSLIEPDDADQTDTLPSEAESALPLSEEAAEKDAEAGNASVTGAHKWKHRCEIVAESYGLTSRECEMLVLLTHGFSSATTEGRRF